MNEIIFMIEEAPEGGYIARAAGESIFTEADDLETLRQRVHDAVYCHFDGGKIPQTIRMHLEAPVTVNRMRIETTSVTTYTL